MTSNERKRTTSSETNNLDENSSTTRRTFTMAPSKSKSSYPTLKTILLVALSFSFGTYYSSFIGGDNSHTAVRGGTPKITKAIERTTRTALIDEIRDETAISASISSQTTSTTTTTTMSLNAWNEDLTKKCAAVDTEVSTGALTADEALTKKKALLHPPPSPPLTLTQTKCKHVYLDFGANRGDSVSHFADASRHGCGDEKTVTPLTTEVILGDAVNTGVGLVERVRRGGSWLDGLERNLRKMLDDHNLKSDSFCAHAYEGNPHFNEQLVAVEKFLLSENPRMLKNVKFHTETVGAGTLKTRSERTTKTISDEYYCCLVASLLAYSSYYHCHAPPLPLWLHTAP